MPYGVGAPRRRAARAFAGITLILSGLAALTVPAGAQPAPTGSINIVKQVEGGADVTAFFTVIGDPDVFNVQATTVGGQGAAPPIAGLPLGSYVVREDGTDGPFQLTSIECDDPDADIDVQGQQAIITLTAQAPDVTCTFTNTLAGAAILAQKVVSGNTTSWTRPARFHISCPELQLELDIEPPVGPGGPGTYTIGQGFIPPATCTISEIDTGSDGPVFVTMQMTNHGVPIASGITSLTFTANVGDNLLLRVTNLFLADVPGQPGQDPPGATTTIAGESTTTTTAATTTTATTIPGGATTTVPGGGATTVPGSGGTTVPGGGGTTLPGSGAQTTTPGELPATGRASRGLVVLALASMAGGLFLVARTRRPAEVRVDTPRD